MHCLSFGSFLYSRRESRARPTHLLLDSCTTGYFAPSALYSIPAPTPSTSETQKHVSNLRIPPSNHLTTHAPGRPTNEQRQTDERATRKRSSVPTLVAIATCPTAATSPFFPRKDARPLHLLEYRRTIRPLALVGINPSSPHLAQTRYSHLSPDSKCTLQVLVDNTDQKGVCHWRLSTPSEKYLTF